MTIFRNFKIQSQRFMTIKNQRTRACCQNGQKRLKITLKVLNDVKGEYPATKKYIEDRLEEECSKENISVDEVIFLFTYWEAKS